MKRDYMKPAVEIIDFKLMNIIMDSADLDNPGSIPVDEGVDWD